MIYRACVLACVRARACVCNVYIYIYYRRDNGKPIGSTTGHDAGSQLFRALWVRYIAQRWSSTLAIGNQRIPSFNGHRQWRSTFEIWLSRRCPQCPRLWSIKSQINFSYIIIYTMHVHMCARSRTRAHTYARARTHIRTHAQLIIKIFNYIYMYIYTFIIISYIFLIHIFLYKIFFIIIFLIKKYFFNKIIII